MYGSRLMARHLRRRDYQVGRMRVRFVAKMGRVPIYQKPRMTIPDFSAGPTNTCSAG